jgi:hypothetical protein
MLDVVWGGAVHELKRAFAMVWGAGSILRRQEASLEGLSAYDC